MGGDIKLMKTLIKFLFVTMIFVMVGKSTDAQILSKNPMNDVVEKKHTKQSRPSSYHYIREADIMWQKRIWRDIDLKQKSNMGLYYPVIPHNDWKSFTTVIMDGIKEGAITAYKDTQTNEFTIPLTYQELIDKMSTTETISVPYYDEDGTMLYKDSVFTNVFEPSDIRIIRLKEDWFFDRQRSVTEVRVLGVCFITEDTDESGKWRGYSPEFWIYFPEARATLAKSEMYNRGNRAARLSFDDVFQKRMFNSVVIKEDNVYDRYITDYMSGNDALYEAERVKNDMFEFEHNLWEY
ncbi:MAG: gliding motility protein GldN [Bacteroidota bacterium]|nr:gliding motility protein GldN [Bacteroidota bacterium]